MFLKNLFKKKGGEGGAPKQQGQGIVSGEAGEVFIVGADVVCKQSKGKLIMYIAPPQSSTSRNVVPEESCLGEPVRKIQLVGSHLESTAECEFTIIETDGSHVCFKCETSDEKDQWFVGLSHVPGLFRRVEDFYIKGDVWGHGATCQVHECYSRFTGKKYALKSRLHSNTESTRAMHNELRILQICAKDPHPAIPDLVDFFFDTNGTIEIVTDLMEGGECMKTFMGQMESLKSEQKLCLSRWHRRGPSPFSEHCP
eukprot:jgi/Picre1/34771/NNA_002237.t1